MLSPVVPQILNWSRVRCRTGTLQSAYKSTWKQPEPRPSEISIRGRRYLTDNWTNIPSNILALMERKLYKEQYHPIAFVKRRIQDYFDNNYKTQSGAPLFSFHEVSPVVTLKQEFESLLLPANHVHRSLTHTYFVNSSHLLT